MQGLLQAAPATSDVVQLYLRESLKSFEQECYLASAVMLGVAAEACMLEAAEAFVQWSGEPARNLKAILENPRTFYVVKLEEFQKRLAAPRGSLPSFPALTSRVHRLATAPIRRSHSSRLPYEKRVRTHRLKNAQKPGVSPSYEWALSSQQ